MDHPPLFREGRTTLAQSARWTLRRRKFRSHSSAHPGIHDILTITVTGWSQVPDSLCIEGRPGQPLERIVSHSSAALNDIALAFAAKSEPERSRMAEHVTDLFVSQAAGFNDAHVELFDQVIGVLADAIETRARARLSEKLADVPNAPPRVVLKFANDDIAVARPVLARSQLLTDSDLVATAKARGRDHMLAISERANLSEPVTDVLVSEGDRVVVNAVASNPTARFSDAGYDALVERSGEDALLQAAIGRRRDIPPKHMAVLFDLAKKAARERLQAEVAQAGRRAVRDAVDASARDIAAETLERKGAYDLAMANVTTLMDERKLDDSALGEMARRGQDLNVVCALAVMAQAPISVCERAVLGPDHDLLLTVARSVGISWPTVKAIISIRKEAKPGPRQYETLEESYGRLSMPTAQRLLRYLLAREAVTSRLPQPPSPSRT
jgi:uncharacterized protein (DUF2336 family)